MRTFLNILHDSSFFFQNQTFLLVDNVGPSRNQFHPNLRTHVSTTGHYLIIWNCGPSAWTGWMGCWNARDMAETPSFPTLLTSSISFTLSSFQLDTYPKPKNSEDYSDRRLELTKGKAIFSNTKELLGTMFGRQRLPNLTFGQLSPQGVFFFRRAGPSRFSLQMNPDDTLTKAWHWQNFQYVSAIFSVEEHAPDHILTYKCLQIDFVLLTCPAVLGEYKMQSLFIRHDNSDHTLTLASSFGPRVGNSLTCMN